MQTLILCPQSQHLLSQRMHIPITKGATQTFVATSFGLGDVYGTCGSSWSVVTVRRTVLKILANKLLINYDVVWKLIPSTTYMAIRKSQALIHRLKLGWGISCREESCDSSLIETHAHRHIQWNSCNVEAESNWGGQWNTETLVEGSDSHQNGIGRRLKS